MSIATNQTPEATGRFFAVRIGPHKDLRQSIMEFASAHHIKAGAIVTCVGSLEQTNLRFANQREGSLHKGYVEITSLVGTFSSSSVHLHLSVADSNGVTLGGHLMNDNLVYTTAELVVVELNGLDFARELDTTYGFNELVVKKAQK